MKKSNKCEKVIEKMKYIKITIDEYLDRDGMYKGQDDRIVRVSIPLVSDDEIERVVGYEKEKREER